ncbi:MAG: hypothetical protein KC496_18310 [Anaerolineae bacterium]|nr:hypothetical protein [Anaerolineae bacterium]
MPFLPYTFDFTWGDHSADSSVAVVADLGAAGRMDVVGEAALALLASPDAAAQIAALIEGHLAAAASVGLAESSVIWGGDAALAVAVQTDIFTLVLVVDAVVAEVLRLAESAASARMAALPVDGGRTVAVEHDRPVVVAGADLRNT